MMTFLSALTKSQRVVAICTIHQPSAKVFKSLDKLVLLSAGRVAFCGQTSMAIPYFQSQGRSMPEHENPADFVIEQINKDFMDPAGVDELLDAWGYRAKQAEVVRTITTLHVPLRDMKRQGVCREVYVLLQRQATLAFRDPTVYSGRLVMCVLTCCLFSWIYIESRERTQRQALPRQWLQAWHLGIPTLMSMVYCFAAGDEFTAVAKEVRANNYRLASYLIAQTCVQLPLMVLIALVSTVPSGFGISGWSVQAFLEIEALVVALLWMYESLAQLLAVAALHPALATMGVTTFWLINFLFGGALVRKEDVPWPLRVFSYIAPYGYASRALTRSEYIHATFEGAVRNPDGSYICPSMLQTGCYGITGEEVLSSLSQVVYNISAENHFWGDLGLLIGIAVFFKILFVSMSFYRCSRAVAIGAPPLKKPQTAAAVLNV